VGVDEGMSRKLKGKNKIFLLCGDLYGDVLGKQIGREAGNKDKRLSLYKDEFYNKSHL